MDSHGRYGGDYDGSTDGTTFTVNNNTNGDSAYINPNQYYDITLHITKGTTMIRLYTGTYAEGRLTYILSEMGITIADASFDRTSNDSRAMIVEFAIDTSDWAEGESHDFVLHIGGTADCELAAIVVLGDTVTPSPAE